MVTCFFVGFYLVWLTTFFNSLLNDYKKLNNPAGRFNPNRRSKTM